MERLLPFYIGLIHMALSTFKTNKFSTDFPCGFTAPEVEKFFFLSLNQRICLNSNKNRPWFSGEYISSALYKRMCFVFNSKVFNIFSTFWLTEIRKVFNKSRAWKQYGLGFMLSLYINSSMNKLNSGKKLYIYEMSSTWQVLCWKLCMRYLI